MRAKAAVHLKFPSKKRLEIVFKALEPEIRKTATKRSRANMEKKGTSLILKVEAKDTVSLRATLNAHLRWISAVYSVFSTLKLLSLSKEE
jgi:tRNA threonylcarbamoyladenosine modification (KEOPS) complex  Pcc1 subunit